MHVLITGSSRGIGLAIAKRYASGVESSLQLSLCARNVDELQRAMRELGLSDDQIFTAGCDVSVESDVNSFVQRAEARFGTIDHVVNNAGFGIFRSIDQLRVEEFDSVLATNLRGVFLITRAALPRMLAAGHGTIVTIASLAGKNGFAGGTAYCAAKFAVRGLMQSMFLEVRDRNIRALTVFPGSVDTAFFNPDLGATRLRSATALSPEDVASAVFDAAMLPQTATISELDIRPTNPKAAA